MNVYEAALAWRRRLAAADQRAARQITEYYDQAIQQIQHALDDLLSQMRTAQAQGQDVKPAWLFQQERYQTLLAIIGLEIDQFARLTGQAISRSQRLAIGYAIEAARELAERQLPPVFRGLWVGMDQTAAEQMIGATMSGPLFRLLSSFGPSAQAAASKELFASVVLSENPRQTGRRLKAVLGTTEARAQMIARTEMHRAHREASQQSYQANPHLIRQWVWVSAMDERTCPVCWAMTGTHHPVDERMGSHPNCRCHPVPVTVDWNDLPGARPGQFDGVPGSQVEVPDGEEAFARLSAREQEAILGPLAYKAYRRGEVTLAELVGYRDDPQWGPVRWTRSIRSLGVPAR